LTSLVKHWRLLAIAAVFFLVVSACGDDDAADTTAATTTTEAAATTEAGDETTTTAGGDTTTTEAAPAGYCDDAAEGPLLWAHEQEPSSWQYNDPQHQLSITAWLIQGMWDGLYGDASTMTFYPELLAEEAVVSENDDGSATLSFKLREGLVWSDGVAFDPAEIGAYLDIIMETGVGEDGEEIFVFPFADRTGYDLITDFRVISPTEFEWDMSAAFAGWKTLFQVIPPMHVWEGLGAAEVNELWGNWETPDGGVAPSTGPMVLEAWNPGVSVVMNRNDLYHGSVSPDAVNDGLACVDGLVMTVVPDTDAQINSMRAGEAHIIMTQPQLDFEQLREDPRFVSAAAPGPVWEHWGLNLYNVHLSDPLVREAMAYAFDKAEVVAALYARVFGEGVLSPDGLWNTFFGTNQAPYYQAHGFDLYAGNNVDAAIAKLEEAGYTQGGDGIYEHPERGKLSLRVGTTGGNALRELQQQILQAQFARAGIEIVIDNVPGSAYFSEVPFSEAALDCAFSGGTEGDCTVWDITQFAWVGGPWPGGGVGTYRCDGFGPYGFCNEAYDAKADECDQTFDEVENFTCYDELDRYVMTLDLDPEQGLFMLPITQKPDSYFYDSEALLAAGVAPDTNNAGPISNIHDFKLAG
jgi:peptide/nickel transport system substrate-binding protein